MTEPAAIEKKLKDYDQRINYLDETMSTLMNRVSNLEEGLAKLQPKPASRPAKRQHGYKVRR
jgi:hypothetical protein